MEIKDYLSAIRRRFTLVVALPLIAVMATAGLLFLQSTRYQSTAVVIVPALSAKGYSTSAVTQYFSTYKDVLVSKPVIDELSKQTGIKSADLVPNLTATTISASSNIINVTYSGTDKTKVPKVVGLAAHLSLDALVMPQLSATQAALVTAQGEQSTTSGALAQFTKQTGLLSPDVDYRLKVAEVSQLTVQLEQARIAGDASRATALTPLIAQRNQELTALAGQLLAYQQLDNAYRSAVSAVAHAQQQVDGVKALIASNASPSAVTVPPAEKTSRIPIIAKGAAISGTVALVLALLMIVVLELLQPTRLGGTRTGGDKGEGAASLNGTPWQAGAAGHENGHGRLPGTVADLEDARSPLP